jgi:hypothetical protein
MNTPLQAKPVARQRGRKVTGQARNSGKRQHVSKEADAFRNRRAASATTCRRHV